MHTQDEYVLEEGDSCFVTCQDPEGERNISNAPRKAVYRDDEAKRNGWDFTIPGLRVECAVEITGVWRDKPVLQELNDGGGDGMCEEDAATNGTQTVGEIIDKLAQYPRESPICGTWESTFTDLRVYCAKNGTVIVDVDKASYREAIERGDIVPPDHC
ncbi:MAG: hypothetical protein CVV05_00085 [Gammaproteobacteria bacterium HGW-Gammaproteobacteria-1]|jgi:hypothetical protein|nr:MAG: hypothetical protein CVV05_00085 [Gammaproteobacteria bacterium HGW-Gammaproteobacteria-1]